MDARIGATADLRVIRPDEIKTLLEPGELGAMLDWKVWNPKTGIVLEEHTQKSESFVQQFLQLLYVQMNLMPQRGANVMPGVRDTANVLQLVSACYGAVLLDVLAGAADATFGIVVGTNATATPLDISNYQLDTLIAHGIIGGTMQYGGVTFGLPGSNTTTSQLTITRNFTANVGGITVNEIGLICRGAYNSGTTGYFLIIRDIIGGGIGVPVGQTLTINYRPQAVI